MLYVQWLKTLDIEHNLSMDTYILLRFCELLQISLDRLYCVFLLLCKDYCIILLQLGCAIQNNNGEVSEWLKEHAWKACIRLRVSRVRIPLSPPLVQILH